MHIGAAASADHLIHDSSYTQTLIHDFNLITTENALKFGPVHPDPDRYDFEAADRIVEFGLTHNLKIRGHTLIWHNQQPDWLIQNSWQRDELLNVLQNHITTVMERYKGKIAIWDVVNEAINDEGSFRETFWFRNLGKDYISRSFHMAHTADPEALLFYNDYGAEEMNKKSDAVYELIASLLQENVPIHGVGLQMHVDVENPPDPDSVAKNIKRLSDLGIRVQITEMDVRIPLPASRADLTKQGDIYRAMLDLCLDNPACTAYILWGFTDRYSWIPGFFDGYGKALIYDEMYNPKPAYDSLMSVFR